MNEEQQFCLRWNNFQANITSQFEALRDEEDFVDVTLACDGQRLKAHKVVLSACSPYFKELFKSNPCKHPILFLRDVAFHHLRALVEFMYAGEVNVAQAQLTAFLRTAESLQIRGLTEAPQRHKQAHIKQQLHHHQQQQSSVPSDVTASAGLDSSSAAEDIASSPECVGIDEDEDALSLSPGDGSSPNPAKRQCLQQDSGDALHQRTQTSTSSSHSDLRQELEAVTKDNPADIVEPKLELPDYTSDGDSKAGAAAFLGLDSNSIDVNASFAAALHGGGMDILPGPSGQSFLGEPSGSLDSGQVDHRKLHSLDPRPCPICNRMYSNLSNLRQHVRLIHNPQTVACPLCSKPFKTKLYLKRHLMSFHELLCGNLGPGGVQGGSKQGGEFYPPPPQVFLGPHPVGEEEERKRNPEGVSKGKDHQNLEIFHVSRATMLHASLPQSSRDEKSGTHNAGKSKDS
ncbi:Longitudinals lacking protein-like, partial [Cryptotermes secundus]